MDRSRFRTGKEKDDWLDWLSDNPPSAAAREELRRKRVADANRYRPRTAPRRPTESNDAPESPNAPPNVTININLPKVKLPAVKLPALPKPRLPSRKLLIIGLMIALVAGGAGWWGINRLQGSSKSSSDAGSAAVQPVRASPSFKPIAPKDKPQLANFEPKVTYYDGRHDTYSFTDLLPGGHITVSEQPLPAKLGPLPQALASVAAQVGAKEQLVTDHGPAYMNTNPKSGSQIIVFTLNNLLIFINSPYGHNSGAWKDYINNLR